MARNKIHPIEIIEKKYVLHGSHIALVLYIIIANFAFLREIAFINSMPHDSKIITIMCYDDKNTVDIRLHEFCSFLCSDKCYEKFIHITSEVKIQFKDFKTTNR